MKHKHLFKKISDGLEPTKNMFDESIEMGENWVTRFKCECGETQAFEDVPSGEYNKALPEEFTMN